MNQILLPAVSVSVGFYFDLRACFQYSRNASVLLYCSLNDDIGNMYVSGSALIAIFLVKKLIYQNELDYIMLFFLLHKVVYCFV